MARKKEIRKLREPIPTLIGAGITEKWYFRHLKDYAHLKLDIKPKYFGSDTAYDMQKFVEGVLAMGGKAICIFDMDTTQWDDIEKDRKTQFIAAYQKNPNVILCGSMPSIEYWFLLHFEKSKSQDFDKINFLDRDEFLKFLNDRANEITDDKLRNDILKMLSDNLRYKDSEAAENNEIQRFYTPKLCENCQIYNKCKDCTLSECPKA